MKHNENPSSGSRVVQCERTDGWTDMKRRIVGFGNFPNVPKIVLYSSKYPKDSYVEPCSCTQQQYSDTCPSLGKLRPTRHTGKGT
jgi:hypothetical protein